MNAQIEELKKEIADKQKELETLEQFPYEKGQLVYVESLYEWIIEFDCIKDFEVLILYSYCLSSNSEYKGKSTLCHTDEITTRRLATEADLNRLPDGHKWKPKKLPTTIEEVCEVLKPSYCVSNINNVLTASIASVGYSSTQQNAERVRAYNNLLNVIGWGNREWPDGDKKQWIWGLPIMNNLTRNHINAYFSNDLKTFQS